MIVTFGDLVRLTIPYIGKSGACDASDKTTRLNVATLLQQYVHRAGSLRRWLLTSRHNLITLPRDLHTILKVKINGKSESAFSKWFDFYDNVGTHDLSGAGYLSPVGVIQEVNSFPTVFDFPGGHVLAELGKKCTSNKTPGHVIIQGVSEGGVDVYTNYKGTNLHGERLDLESGVTKRTLTKFRKITSITKSETDDHVKFFYQTDKTSNPGLLSWMTPLELAADFRRARILLDRCDPNECYRIELLGRVEIFSNYHDNDIIPIQELSGIIKLAQADQSLENNNPENAVLKYQASDRNIEDANQYGRNVDITIDIVHALSGGSIPHLD